MFLLDVTLQFFAIVLKMFTLALKVQKMLEMAGKIGDGVFINASHPSDIEYDVNGK